MMASLIRAIFFNTAGDEVTSARAGAPSGGNGEREKPCPIGDVTVDAFRDPQFEQYPGLLGKDASDRDDGESGL